MVFRRERNGFVRRQRIYRVGSPVEAAEAARRRQGCPPPVALFMAHGMGQQVPFTTIDRVVERLVEFDDGRHSGGATARVVARCVRSAGEVITRAELLLRDAGGNEREVHVYEGYWAPLTEGEVKLRDVVRFLWLAGRNGFRNQSLHRWLFDKYQPYRVPVRHVLYIFLALATLISLIAINSVLTAVSLLWLPFERSLPSWLSNDLFYDLTTVFHAILAVAGAFALSLLLSSVLRRAVRPSQRARFRIVRALAGLAASSSGLLSLVLFGSTLVVVILGGAAVVGALAVHANGAAQRLFDPGWTGPFNDIASRWLLGVAAIGLIVAAGGKVGEIGNRVLEETGSPIPSDSTLAEVIRWWRDVSLTWAAAFLVLLVVVGVFVLLAIGSLEGFDGTVPEPVRLSMAWVLLIGASLFTRRKLIEYVGDVAAYIHPHTLDRFYRLREQVKSCVYKALRAVYTEESGYAQVVVAGHSLGSVVVYDALNRLINDDLLALREARRKKKAPRDVGFLDVVARTPLLLTFGSPLDKIAFVFGMQAEKTTKVREMLAAAVQPMLVSDDHRPPRWINLWSKADIISGSLSLYDLPEDEPQCNVRRVENREDPDAITLLLAHNQYWDGSTLVEILHRALTGGLGALQAPGQTAAQAPAKPAAAGGLAAGAVPQTADAL